MDEDIDNDPRRAAFEKWAAQFQFRLLRYYTDEYDDLTTQSAWMAWCASQRISGDRSIHYERALEDILRQPQETMSDGKAVAAMVRIARAALGANDGKRPA